MTNAAMLLAVVALSAVGTWGARRYALARRLLDQPGDRRNHVVPTPRGGGIGPVVGIVAGVLVALPDARGLAIALAVSAVAFIGAWDDHRPLSPTLRLSVHAAAAALAAGAIHPPAQAPVAFAIAWFAGVALVNIWNFMDGIDGIASTQAILVALALAALSHGGVATAALAIGAACAAFLPFNFPRARVFMGDVGSGAIGLAVAAVGVAAAGVTADGVLRASLPLSAFVLDAGLTLARRMLRRERWWEAHSQHLYQVLARRYGHVPVTVGYAAWTGAAVFLACFSPPAFMIPVWGIWYAGGISLWLALQNRITAPRVALEEKDR